MKNASRLPFIYLAVCFCGFLLFAHCITEEEEGVKYANRCEGGVLCVNRKTLKTTDDSVFQYAKYWQ